MPYIVKCWIPVDEEYPKIHKTIHAIQSEYEDCRDMQPENHYEVVEVEKEEYPDGHIEWNKVQFSHFAHKFSRFVGNAE